MSEYLEDVNGVTDVVLQCWVDGQVDTESVPGFPGVLVGIGSCRYDAEATLELRSAQVTEEIISGCTVSKRQGCLCG